jgi:hypothetical protein
VFFLVLVILLFLAQIAAFAGFFGLMFFRGIESGFGIPTSDEDRAVVVRIGDLVPADAVVDEIIHKWRSHRDGTHLKSHGDAEGVRLYCEAIVAPNAAYAEQQFLYHSETRPSLLQVDPDAELGSEARSDLYSWGEHSVLYTLHRSGRPAGIFFVARQGERVFVLAITGRKLDDPRVVEMLLRPVLTEFERYEG